MIEQWQPIGTVHENWGLFFIADCLYQTWHLKRTSQEPQSVTLYNSISSRLMMIGS